MRLSKYLGAAEFPNSTFVLVGASKKMAEPTEDIGTCNRVGRNLISGGDVGSGGGGIDRIHHQALMSLARLSTVSTALVRSPKCSQQGIANHVQTQNRCLILHTLSTCKSPAHETLYSLLLTCPSMHHLKRLHAQLTTRGFLAETLTLSKLIAFCSASGAASLRHARQALDRFILNNFTFLIKMIRQGSLKNHSDRIRHARETSPPFYFHFPIYEFFAGFSSS